MLEDVNSVERMLIDGVEQGVVAVLQVIIMLGVMLYVNWKLALLASHHCRFWPGVRFGTRSPPSPLSSAASCFLGHERLAAR